MPGRGVLGDFQILLRDGSLLKQKLGAFELRTGKRLVGAGLLVIGKCLRDIRALDAYQELTLLDGVADPGVNFHDAARRQRDHWDVTGDVRAHHPSHLQFRRGSAFACDCEGELAGVVHLGDTAVRSPFDGSGRRGRLSRVGAHSAAAPGEPERQRNTNNRFHKDRTIH